MGKTKLYQLWLASSLCLLTCFNVAKADSALNDYLELNPQQNLNAEDLKILKELSKNQKSTLSVNNQEAKFIYGLDRPKLICSLLHVCDIALQPGENVVDLKAGDNLRWIIERSASGSEEGIIEHITVKPTDLNLSTNLRIYTDRRTYYIELKSSAKEYMPSISFIYPEQSINKYNQIKQSLQEFTYKYEVKTDDRLTYIEQLNFNYALSGSDKIMPLRVFNDGSKTYIQMNPNITNQTLPALVAINQSDKIFSSEQTALLNYRIKEHDYIVDGLPEHLRLILGENGSTYSVDIVLQH